MPRRRSTDPCPPESIQMGTLNARAVLRRAPGQPGFYVFPDGTSYWRVTDSGDRRMRWEGQGTRDQVTGVLSRLCTEGLNPPTPTEEHGDVRTVGDLLTRWVQSQMERTDLSAHTVRHYSTCARPLMAEIGQCPSCGLGEAVNLYREARVRAGTSPRRVVQEEKVLRSAWRWGAEQDLVPALDLPPPLPPLGRSTEFTNTHRLPTEKEVFRVIGQLQGDIAIAVRLLHLTGARVSEVCALRGEDLDESAKAITFKSGRNARSVPLSDLLLLSLLSGRGARGEAPLLDLPGAAAEAIRDHMGRACTRARVPRFTADGLHRLALARLRKAKVTPDQAAAILGMSPIVVRRLYAALSKDRQADEP